MNLHLDPLLKNLMGGIIAFLTIASFIGWLMARHCRQESKRAVIDNLNSRIRAWWLMAAVFSGAILAGKTVTLILFALISLLALREFITLTPTRRADHRALFWCFFIILPLQYILIGINWYGLLAIFIPVYAFLFIPIRNALAADSTEFFSRTSRIQWALMICVYCVSYAPALLLLDLPGSPGQNARLLFFFVIVVQMSDVLQYIWGKLLGRHKIAPHLSPNKTLEGFVGGIASACALGAALWWLTPFTPAQAAGYSFVITLMGFFGGLVMSAIKRDRGVKDFGNILPGHGGILDRIDSLCFAAPIFFHLIRYFFTP